jgi:hypothetical protein
MRLNDPGQSNGIFEMWIDGKLEAQRTGLNWVGSYQEYGINAIMLENYWNAGSPVTQERYLDNLVVSTQPIGCGTVSTPAPAPIVSAVSPNSGTMNGGTSVIILGSNFQSGASVSFGGSPASSVTFQSSTQLQAVTPAHAAGSVDVQVTNPDGLSGVLPAAFTFTSATQPAPQITNISPTSGSTTGGTLVTVNGSNFLNGALVAFGGVNSPNVTMTSSNQLVAVTPAHPAGIVDISVMNPDGQVGTLSGAFNYQSPGGSSSFNCSVMQNGWLFCDDFEACDVVSSGKYFDFGGGNYIVTNPVHSGRCAVRTGTPPAGQPSTGWGKIVARLPATTELWMRGWVYFPSGVPLGGHIWRPYDSPFGTDGRTLQFDFNVPSWGEVQMFLADSAGGPQIAVNTGYSPLNLPDQWQCWETHIKLNDLGQANGRMAFYVNGTLVREAVNQVFRTVDKRWQSIDVQSNYDGGGWWVLDDFVVSTSRVGCGN